MSSDESVAAKVQSLLKAELSHGRDLAGEIHSLGKAALKPLITALQDRHVRLRAIDALSRFGSEASEAVPATLSILREGTDFDESVRSAIELLISIGGPAIAPVVERLPVCDDNEFDQCRRVLAHVDADPVITQLLPHLNDANPIVRRRVCNVLSRTRYGNQIDPTPQLIERLSDDDERVRDSAAAALQHFGNTQALCEAYGTGDPLTRAGCLRALSSESRLRNSDGVKLFLSALSDDHGLVRIAAGHGLIEMSLEITLSAIRKDFENEDAIVRMAALRFCEHNKDIAHRFASEVRRLVQDDQPGIRRRAAAVIASHSWYHSNRPTLIRSILEEALGDVSDLDRSQYLYSLIRVDSVSHALIPAVINCLKDANRGVSVAAAYSLGRIGAGRPDAIEALTELLDNPDMDRRMAAIDGLRTIGPTAVTALPKLRELLQVPELTYDILRTLESLGPAAEPALWDVVAVIGRRTEQAPYTLAAIGTKEAIVQLAKAVDSYGNGDRKDYDSACDALHRIGESARPVLDAEFQKAEPGDYSWILAGLDLLLEGEEFFHYVLTAHLNGNNLDRYAVLKHLNAILSRDEPCLRQFIQNPDAISRLVDGLDGGHRFDRMAAMEIFVLMHEELPVFTDFYQDRLVKCLRHTLAETDSSYDRDRIREIGHRLGIPPEQFAS